MDRRSFLKVTGAGAAASAAIAPVHAVATPAPGARGIEIAGPHHDLELEREFADALAQRITLVSGGRLTGSRTPGALTEGLGVLKLEHGDDLYDRDRAFAWFTGLPRRTGLAPEQQAAWMTAGGGQMLLDALAAEHGLKVFTAGCRPPSVLWTRAWTAQIRLYGHYFAAGGIERAVYGAVRTTTNPFATDPSGGDDLGERLVGEESAGFLPAVLKGLASDRPYAIAPGLMPQGTVRTLAMDLKGWERLGPSDQAVIEASISVEARAHELANAAHEPLARRIATDSHDVQVVSFLPPAASMLDRAAADIVADIARSSASARRIADSHAAFRALVSDPGDLPAA